MTDEEQIRGKPKYGRAVVGNSIGGSRNEA
jgi:hypothetical protein